MAAVQQLARTTEVDTHRGPGIHGDYGSHLTEREAEEARHTTPQETVSYALSISDRDAGGSTMQARQQRRPAYADNDVNTAGL